MLKTDNLLSGYPFIGYYPYNYPDTNMATFPVNDLTEGARKSNKIMKKIIMGPGGADSVKSRKYNPMVVRSSQPL